MTLALVQQQTIGLNDEWLQEWVSYRAEDKKKPMTPRAIKMTQKWLLAHSEQEQERLISHAIRNNWEGLHYIEPPKDVANSTRSRTLQEDLTDTGWAQ